MHVTEPILQKTLARAEAWQQRANELLTSEEKTIQEQLARLLDSPRDRVVMTKMIDQSFRSSDHARVSDQINTILSTYGVPEFFSVKDKMLMRLFLGVGRHFPHVSVPRVIDKMRDDSSRSVIPGEAEVLTAHLKARRSQGVRMNINHLGEAVLGETEAAARLQTYLRDLRDPAIETISVKISTIYSQISSLAFESTLKALQPRLAQLYQAARDNEYLRPDGSRVPKSVNLDMEEFRDLEITYEAFVRTLSLEAFHGLSAGIVLQAYLPDAFQIQQRLTAWARERVEKGGHPVYLRIVKGANMEMELVESSLNNWPLAPYGNKKDVDANYKRMVDFGLQPENIAAVRLGIASHNLFDLAYAFERAREHRVADHFTFEMLEGMADHVRRAICETTGQMLLYAPVATREEFINAIAYLIRRLDENTAPENFLRYASYLKTGSKAWDFLANQFVEAYHHRNQAPTTTRRVQDRSREPLKAAVSPYETNMFVNAPDTDWAIAANRQWAQSLREKWHRQATEAPLQIPVVIAAAERFDDRDLVPIHDPCRQDPQKDAPALVAHYALANQRDAEEAVAIASADPDGWRRLTHRQRQEILANAAQLLRKARGELMTLAAASTGKVFTEADPEISEAIDFIEYYPHSVRSFEKLDGLRLQGKGVGLVISPWNFPIAIPTGGVAAALAAGNTVIFKPASDAVLTAYRLCQTFWQAGVSRNTLQFVPCRGSREGHFMAVHPQVDFVILTGSTDTGMALLQAKPDIALAAETGGKNATIVTAMSDRDQAIKNVIHSAFSNSGQKCSATSLLILEKEVYADAHFRKSLADAAESYATGSPWAFKNRMGPLIKPPSGDLAWALTELAPGESWLVQPRMIDENPRLWTPGIKWDVQPNSRTHMTEFFGPLLGVMCARDLEHAIALANAPGYGLTAGLESLDPREQAHWKEKIIAGNLYINRPTTGAIVLRQPFGGQRKSALGAGIKAGGPNYVQQFMHIEESAPAPIGAIQKESAWLRLAHHWRLNVQRNGFGSDTEDIRKTIRAMYSYLYWMEQEFSCEKDYFHLRGQDNLLRYRAVGKLVVRIHPDDSLFEVLARIAAARIAGCDLIVSRPQKATGAPFDFLDTRYGRQLLGGVPVRSHSDEQLIAMLSSVDRIRYADRKRIPEALFAAAAQSGFYIAHAPVLTEGRIELLRYFREQAICNNYHRYGNLGERANIT